MLRKVKKLLVIFCVFAVTFLSLGVISLFPAHAESNVTTADAIAEFVMEDGASIRKSTDKRGIRFNALLSEKAYGALQKANAEFGMLIVPKDYVTTGFELTVENVFGKNAVYVPNVKASEVEQGKKAIIQVTEPTVHLVDGVYKIYGSIVNVLDNNIPRGFIGRAYLKVNGKYYLADYAGGLVENNTRSMAYVAKCAIEDNDKDSASLQTDYVDKVKNESYEYTVNEVTVEIDGSVTSKNLKRGTATFGTAVSQSAESRFGFESYGVDSFVSMKNAEFNVVYKAVPVNVVVDADATATELYAANELADYIEKVTGKAVTVGVESRATNNIYISTDSSLGLAMDSFKLSTDDKGNIHINGVDERGTLYGVYEYEEANMGIKFLSETYTHVPVTNKQISTLSDVQKKTYSPAFAYRTYMNNGIGLDGDANVKYSSHLRFIAQFSQEKTPTELMHQVQYFMPWMAQPWLTASHSLLTYAAVGAYKLGRTDLVDATFDENGLFKSCGFKAAALSSEADGALDYTVPTTPDICYSSSVAKNWVIAGLKYMIDTYPTYEYFMLGQADKTTECNCSTCKDALKGSFSNWFNPPDNKADLVARFIRDVVTAVNKGGTTYSSKKIVMFAYQNTETAPKNAITDMPDNVYIQWAPIDQDRYFALDDTNPINWKTQIGMEEGRFLIWSYETDFGYYFNYYPTMHTWIENFQTYKDLGVEAVMMQSTWNTTGVADSYLDAYVASKLLWSFETGEDNVTKMETLRDEAKEEFIEYFYGADAKKFIVEYYNRFDALYETKFGTGGYLKTTRSFQESDLTSLLNLINQAKEKTTDETYIQHLTMLSFTPRYMLCQYCDATDDALLQDMNKAGVTRSRESVLIENDGELSGYLMFKQGGTEVTTIEYDTNGRISHLTLEVPDNQEWTASTPRFTADYMNDLYKNGIRTLSMWSTSSSKTGDTIYTYGSTANYHAATVENISILESCDAEGFRFNYVDHGNEGQTVGTTLDLYFNYYKEGESANANVQNNSGLTLASNVRAFEATEEDHGENKYAISYTQGTDSNAYFSKETVNAWIEQGYVALSMTLEFEESKYMDQMVAFDTAYRTNDTGYSRWTFSLTKDTPIQLWAQKDGGGNLLGGFAISDIQLSKTALTYHANYAKVVSDSYDENGRLTQLIVEIPDGTNWWECPPQLTASYLNGLYADGVPQMTINATSTTDTNTFYTLYNGSTTETLEANVPLTENGGALQFSYVNLGNGATVATTLTLDFTYTSETGKTPDELAAEIGMTLANGTQIEKDGNGGYVLSNVGLENGAGGFMSAYFSAEKVNEWISQGYTALTMNVSFEITDTIGQVVGLNGVQLGEGNFTQLLTDEDGSAEWTFNLVENSPIQFWAQKDGGVNRGAFTLSNIAFIIDPAVLAAEIGATMNGDTTISKNNDGSYTISGAMGDTNGLEFSATQVNEWLSQGYDLLSMHVSFTPVEGVINKTVAWTQSTSWLTDETGNVDWTFTLKQDEKICLWTQWGDNLYSAAFIISNLQLSQSQESIAAEIGMTLANGTQIEKDGNGGYVLSNVGLENGAGGFMSAYISAAKVNEWLENGYQVLKVKVAFTSSDTIDQVVGLNGAKLGEGNFTELFTSGNDWTFILVKDSPIQFWAQKDGGANSGAFTLYDVQLKEYDTYYKQGYATITNEQIGENNLLYGFTAAFNNETFGWDANVPTLTAEYLNFLYRLGVKTIEFSVTGNAHQFITGYNNSYDYGNLNPIQLVENGGALSFSHVNVGAGNGYPTASTVTVTLKYVVDINAEIGATANNVTKVYLNADGSYDVYDTRGADSGLEFTAAQVNAWLDAGYGSISLRLTFTPVANVIDEVVIYGQSTTMDNIGYIEDFSGTLDVTLILTRDKNILIWSQANHGGQPNSTFTLSNFTLNHYSFNCGCSTIVDEQIDENGRLTSLTITIPEGRNWWEYPPELTASYLNDLYADGVRQVTIHATSTTDTNNFYTLYNGSGTAVLEATVSLAENGGALQFSYVNLGGNGVTVATTLTLTFSYSA